MLKQERSSAVARSPCVLRVRRRNARSSKKYNIFLRARISCRRGATTRVFMGCIFVLNSIVRF